MNESSYISFNDCNKFAGSLEEEMKELILETDTEPLITTNTAFLTIFCC